MRILLASLIVLALASAAEFALDRADRERRADDPPIERLVAPERSTGLTVAAIAIESAEGSLLYGRKEGRWRCREAFGAVCDESGIQDLLGAFLQARGVERAAPEGSEADYGFAPGNRLTVRFLGPQALKAPDGDVLFSFDVGRSFAGGPNGRALVRESGSGRALEIDRDPRRALAGGSAAVPPLVDPIYLAGSLTGEFRGFREIRIAPRGGEAMRIARDPAAPAEADAPWILERGERRDSFPGWRVGGYVGLWLRGRFEGFDGARDLAAMGLDAAPGPRAPAARIVLVPEEGEPVELVVSDVDDRRRARVWNVRTNVVGIVPGEIQPLLAPRAELFLDTTRPNPWEAWLRKR